jgi:hypothetical protein
MTVFLLRANYAGYRSKIHLSQLFKIPEPLLKMENDFRKKYIGPYQSVDSTNALLKTLKAARKKRTPHVNA